MIVTRLELRDFRNYERFELRPHPRLTVLAGPNAAGKTNIIEALQLLTAASSFRRPRWEDLVRWGRPEGLAALRAEEGERRLDVELDVSSDGGHLFKVNGQARKRTSDVAGRLPSVTFTPDDLDLVKGSSERRRSAIDDLGGQLSAAYSSSRRDYGKVVRQRNALLKEQAGGDRLEVWDEQLATLGARLLTHRLRLLAEVMPRVADRYASMAAGERLSWSYEDRSGLPKGPAAGPVALDAAREAIAGEIRRREEEERRRSITLVGPHRDDIAFLVNDRGARSFASQGQQRTVALAWKLGEVDTVEEVLHEAPVLLLDDVMSELDASRRSALTAAVSGRTQTFVTTTNLGYFEEATLHDASVVELVR